MPRSANWAFGLEPCRATQSISSTVSWPRYDRARRSLRRHRNFTCMDAVEEAHLRCTLQPYARYYNESRVHRALNKGVPFHRAIERLGAITSMPVLGGL